MTAPPDDVWVVLPTYNERDNITPLVQAVRGQGYRALIVDDGSPDGTGELADELAAADAKVKVIHRPGKLGLGSAYAVGFNQALSADALIVCEMDCDFSHDPHDLPRLVQALGEGAEVAVGSRYVAGGSVADWPWYRRLISRGGNAYARWMLGLSVRDATGGFRAFEASALRELDAGSCQASGYGFQVEMISRSVARGHRITEVPIKFRERRHGRSKMGAGIVLEAMWLVTRWGIARLVAGLGWPFRGAGQG